MGCIIIKISIILLALLLVVFLGCKVEKETPPALPEEKINEGETMGTLKLTSAAFANNGNIPSKYTCQGEDINPPLNISGIPANAKSLVLIIDDPDAPSGTWDHWVVWNISIVTKIEEDSVPMGAVQGVNSFSKNEYGGPCPPPGNAHRYMHKLYALDATLNLNKNSKKSDVERAMQGHILDQTTLVGVYKKR